MSKVIIGNGEHVIVKGKRVVFVETFWGTKIYFKCSVCT